MVVLCQSAIGKGMNPKGSNKHLFKNLKIYQSVKGTYERSMILPVAEADTRGVLRPATLLKKRLWHRRFPVNFVKFLRTPFLQNTSGRLLPQLGALS